MAFVLSLSRLRVTPANRFGNPTGIGTGTVTSVAPGPGITTAPNPIVGAGTVSLITPVVPGLGGSGADLSATGGAGQYVKQVGVGAAFTVGTIPAADIGAGFVKVDGSTPLTGDWTAGNVSVGLGAAPAASAVLNLSSTTKGFLMPRMTEAQKNAIAAPATGLQIYNTTTNVPETYNGTRWVTEAEATIRVDDYGAVADGQNNFLGNVSGGSNALTISALGGNQFSAADQGKDIWIFRAGAAGTATHKTTIQTFNNPTSVTLAVNATTTVIDGLVWWGTDNTTPFQNASAATAGGFKTLETPQGRYIVDGAAITVTTQNVLIKGQGLGSTQLMQASLTAKLIEWTFAGAKLCVSDLTLVGPGTASTSNMAVSYTNGASFGSSLERVWIEGFYDGVVVGPTLGQTGVTLHSTEIFDCLNEYVRSSNGIAWVAGTGFSQQTPHVGILNITAGTATLTATVDTFSTRDIGKRVAIRNAGAGGSTVHLSTITAVASRTSCTIANNAISNVVNGDGTIGVNTQVGVHVTNGGLLLDHLNLVSQAKNVFLNPGNGQAVLYNQFSDCFFDSAFDNGFQMTPSGTGVVRSSVFVDCWFASAGNLATASGNPTLGYGFHSSTASTVSNNRFIGCRFVNNWRDGVFLNGAGLALFDFDDSTFDGNGAGQNNTFYHINANAFSNISVQNCKFQTVDFNPGTTMAAGVTFTNVGGTLKLDGNRYSQCTAPVQFAGTTPTTPTLYENSTQVGIGTVQPTARLTIESDSTAPAGSASIRLVGQSNTERYDAISFSGASGAYQGVGAAGTMAAPAATPANQDVLSLTGAAYDNAATPTRTGNIAIIRFRAAENITTAAQGSIILFETTPIGSTTAARAERLRLDAAGRLYTNLGTASTNVAQIGGTVFSQTANSTTTANNLTTLFGTGVGSLTLPANLLIVGRTIEIEMGGFISAADGGAGTKTLTLTLGGVTVATGTSGATFTTVNNAGWRAKAFITCRTTGGGGTVIGGGSWDTQIATATLDSVLAVATGTAACNTAAALAIDFKLNNGNAVGTSTTTWARVMISN